MSRSVWNDVSSGRRPKAQMAHGATFPANLAIRAIRMYSREGDLVLDPFMGTGTTLHAAKYLERCGIGFELYEKFYDGAMAYLNQTTFMETKYEQKMYNVDCRELLNYVEPDSVQLIFTSPPYANFIQRSVKDRQTTHKKSIIADKNVSVVKQYGEDDKDFGNLEYYKYLDEVVFLMRKLYTVTKPGGYNIWVVKDHRDPQNGLPFIPLHSDIAEMGTLADFLWHDLIVWDQNENRRLVVLGYPSVFYTNINHTYLVVLRKPVLKK